MQKGGTSMEWYAHWHDSLEEAEEYRADAAEHSWDSLSPQEIEFPATFSQDHINEILGPFGDAVEAILADHNAL